VPVRAGDGGDPAARDRLDDRRVVVGGVDHHHRPVVAHQPDVVGDLPLAAVEGEDAVGGDQLDAGRATRRRGCHAITTTLRRTSPRCIF
jgi:hypothetical protein